MLGNRCGGDRKRLSLKKLRQGRFVLGVHVGFAFQHSAETGVNVFPTTVNDIFALGGKLLAAALKYGSDSFVHMVRSNRAKQLAADKGQQFLFTFCQPIKSGFCKLRCGQDCVMIRYLGIVDNEPHLRSKLHALHKGKLRQQRRDKIIRRLFHIGSDVIAVRSRIGQQPLFVQGLGIIKGLLGSKAVNAVGFPLQGSKVIELRRLYGFLLFFQRSTNGLRMLASRLQGICFGSVGNALTFRFHTATADLHNMIFFFLERGNLPVALHQQIQRWGKNAPHIQRLMVQHGEKAGSIDAHQPICPHTTQRRMIQRVILSPVFERVHALADRAVLHRRNPQSLERLAAISLFIDKAENQLTLAPGVAAVHQLRHIGAMHQLL